MDSSCQTIDAPEIDGLAVGVERYFETMIALAQRGSRRSRSASS
jgi:hypothetical protein